MRDAVLIGPSHSRAEGHLDVRGGVHPIPNEDVRDTECHRFLRNRPLHRATCSKGSMHRGDRYACAGQCQGDHQDCTYENPYCSVTQLDPSFLDSDGATWMLLIPRHFDLEYALNWYQLFH
jgi:hypothetical protein